MAECSGLIGGFADGRMEGTKTEGLDEEGDADIRVPGYRLEQSYLMHAMPQTY